MVIVRLKGGMGNQMFQYAFGKRMAQVLNTELRLDLSLLLDRVRGTDHVYRDFDLTIFQLEPQFYINPSLLRTLYKANSSKICKMTRKWANWGKNYVKEPHFHIVEELLTQPTDNTIYEGWWQGERYFADIADDIRKDFAFVHPLLEESKPLLERIQQTNSICLNVRRTDFLKVSNLNTTNKDYFLRAAKKMAESIDSPHFFIFSDDVEWCAQNLNLSHPTTLVTHAHKGEKFGNYMQLMKACKHFIIPNSSFAWWAVWLSEHKNKQVIAPKKWFNDAEYDTSDLVPAEWVRM